MDLSKTFHVVIDVHSRFTCALDKRYRKRYEKDIRYFADQLRRYGLQTVWVAMPYTVNIYDIPKIYPKKIQTKWKHAYRELSDLRINKAGQMSQAIDPRLHMPKLHDDEVIYLKYKRDAFVFGREAIWMSIGGAHQSGQSLGDYALANGFKHMILTGMSAGQCVAKTIEGGLNFGLNITAVTDLIASATEQEVIPSYFDRKAYATFQQKLTHENINANTDKLTYVYRTDVLANVKAAFAARQLKKRWSIGALFAS